MDHTSSESRSPSGTIEAFETNMLRAPESASSHATCSGADVSYTGTETAAASQIAKSHSTHS